MRRLLYAAYFLEVGLLLVVLPWTTFWDRNYLFDIVPQVRAWLLDSYTRGAVSGLGLVNVGVGLGEVAGAVGDWLDRPRTPGGAGLAPPPGR
jgi:hypothetical protein